MTPDKKLLILLHGYGANGMDLMPIGTYLENALLSLDLDYLAPDAFQQCDANPYGYQWFKLSPDKNYSYNDELSEVSKRLFLEIIQPEIDKRGMGMADVILCGFSQGGMLALSTTLTAKEKPLATICLSGLLVNEIKPIGDDQNNLLIMHGDRDDVLPIDFYYKTIKLLDGFGIEYEAKTYSNLGHTISQDELNDMRIFLENL